MTTNTTTTELRMLTRRWGLELAGRFPLRRDVSSRVGGRGGWLRGGAPEQLALGLRTVRRGRGCREAG